LLGNLVKRSQPINICGRKICENQPVRFPNHMVNFVNYFCFRLQVTTDQVCTFAKKKLWIRLLRFLRKILCHVRPGPVRSEIAAVREGPYRRVKYEPIGSGHAMVHMNRLKLYPSHFHPVPSSESLELDPIKIVLETSWTSFRQSLQNHFRGLPTVNRYLAVEERDGH